MWRRNTCELVAAAVATMLLLLAIIWTGIVQIRSGDRFLDQHQQRKQEHGKIMKKEDTLDRRLGSIEERLDRIQRRIEALPR